MKMRSAWIEKRVQPEVLPFCYSWKTLLRAGIPLAGGSDAPVEDADPLAGLYAAIFRNKCLNNSQDKGIDMLLTLHCETKMRLSFKWRKFDI
jgi:predicted amidohydrolase YtcJ